MANLHEVTARALRAEYDAVTKPTWGTGRYAKDPAAYCREVHGFEPWSGQCSILEAVRDNRMTSVRSGQKVGKSRVLAAIAWWWLDMYEDGAVLIHNVSGKQLEAINWKEIVDLHRTSGRCAECRRADPRGPRPCLHSAVIPSEPLKSSYGGYTWGSRRIRGATSRSVEGIQGFSGAHLLVLADEASGLDENIYQALVGNTAAQSAKLVMTGNPTRSAGPFFDSHHRAASLFKTVHISSLDAARENVPGLASFEYCEMVKEQDERGEKSPFYQIRVLGNFPTRAEEAIYALEDILAAQNQERYAAAPADGRLVIAIDPAGESGLGDQSVVSAVRGMKVLEQKIGRGWSVDDHVSVALELVRDHGGLNRGEKPLVAIDADGVGANIARRFDDVHQVELVRVYLGQNAREWNLYDTVGDQAHALLSRWLRHGGVFPISPKLEQEMQVYAWVKARRRRMDREIEVLRTTSKREIRQVLHRSPDRLDSLRVFVWAAYIRGVLSSEDTASDRDDVSDLEQRSGDVHDAHDATQDVFDPYAAADLWQGRR